MKLRILIITLLALIPFMALGRMFQIIDPKKLIADSKLVFVGQVRSVTASGIVTRLSYPTLEGVSFPCLTVEMEVLAPFKGVRKGDVVRVMMLSIAKSEKAQFMYSPPEVLEPDKGDIFFLCLDLTQITNVFAAPNGPYDENMSVSPLHRRNKISTFNSRDDGRELLLDDKRSALIWNLANQAGEIMPDGVAKLSNTYAAEIGKASTNEMVYLEWKACTNSNGWISDVPKGFCLTTSDVKK